MANEHQLDTERVVRFSRLNIALQNLSLTEVRIILLAIVDNKEKFQDLSADLPLRVSAIRYAEYFGQTLSSAYEILLKAEKSLFERQFSFINDEENKIKARWFSQVIFAKNQGAIEIIFSPAVVSEILLIDNAENYLIEYLLSQTVNLSNIYSVRLYEILSRLVGVSEPQSFELDHFREQLGINSEQYLLMSDFKKRILVPAIDEINEKTDITASYEQEKRGRVITGFRFQVTTKT